MMTKTVDVPTSATSVFTLLGQLQYHCNHVVLQAPITNDGSVYWGDSANQPFVVSESLDVISIRSTKMLYIKGTSGDEIRVGVL